MSTYCARPSCGRMILPTEGPGRPRRYCSDACRRAADRAIRIARSREALALDQLRRARHTLAAHGAGPLGDPRKIEVSK